MTLTPWVAAGTFLLACVGACGVAAWRRKTFEALIAMELAGVLTTLALVCLTVAYQRTTYGDVPIISAVLTWVGGLVFVRFLDRSRA